MRTALLPFLLCICLAPLRLAAQDGTDTGATDPTAVGDGSGDAGRAGAGRQQKVRLAAGDAGDAEGCLEANAASVDGDMESV